MQPKLLRYLEMSEVRRVGDAAHHGVNVRLLCASHCDLQEFVENGVFREDLFFRINTFEIHLPPLRERKEDIPELARFLIARRLNRPSAPPEILPPNTVEVLMEHQWPSNIRELANALEYGMILSGSETIRPTDLPESCHRRSRSRAR